MPTTHENTGNPESKVAKDDHPDTTTARPKTEKPAATTEPGARIVSADTPSQSKEEPKTDEMKTKKKVDDAPARAPQRFSSEEDDQEEPRRKSTSTVTREHKLEKYKEGNGASKCKNFLVVLIES